MFPAYSFRANQSCSNMEVTYIWKARPKITLTNCLFFVNRYLPILRAFAFTIFSFYPSSDQVICDRWIDFNSYCTMINVATGECEYSYSTDI